MEYTKVLPLFLKTKKTYIVKLPVAYYGSLLFMDHCFHCFVVQVGN